ncbi:unnamed protein product [Clavelina lepadiformis]|uniref:Dixin n=1 Tax=Clavelina lepadiformis TaxID=159417 RepID=A0ABP0FQU3_CLALP
MTAMDLQEQVKAYTAWVNSQLKKRSQRIEDLGQDLKDGSVLITVVEIVSGQDLGGVKPKNEAESKANIVKVLNFMKTSGIKLHHVTVDEIVAGNVKALMQLILALAAHFKPASIGGRKHGNGDKHHSSSPASKYRWKNTSGDGSPSSGRSLIAEKTFNEMETELAHVRNLAGTLQKLLVEEANGIPVEGANDLEDNIILRARIGQADSEKQRLEGEIEKLRLECRNLTTEKEVSENRLKQQENEILSLRQELMHCNLDRDKLKSEKAELEVDLQESQSDIERYRLRYHEREAAVTKLENELTLYKAEQSRLLLRKEDEISHLQMRLKNNANLNDSVFHDPPVRLPHSPGLSPAGRSPVLARRSPGSPILDRRAGEKLSRRSPVTRSHPPRRKKIIENAQTRILYFTDRDMTPAMTTIPKRVGDITLGDFKASIKKYGNYRFIFKALDPELGTVKEEVFHDDDVIPGWEGKIVAWVEEELRV